MTVDLTPPTLQAPAPARPVVFAGQAELRDAYTGLYFGQLKESCTYDGAARVEVALARPFKLSGSERLEVHVSYSSLPVVRVGAQGETVLVAGWAAPSRIGCVAAGQPVTLDFTPGGLLGSLLVLHARGQVRAAELLP